MRPQVRTPEPVTEAKYKARSAATSPAMAGLARLGYAIKGVVYVLIGFLAFQLAIGHGGNAPTDQSGALDLIAREPFGKFLMVIVAIGLLAFALWSLIQAIFDTEGKGRRAKGIVARIGYAAVGVSYAILGIGAFQLVTGSGGPRNSTSTTQNWTALLLKQPFGVVLVVLVGLVILGVAVYLFAKAKSANFRSRLNLASVTAQVRKVVIGLGRFGYAALGVVLAIVGIFMIAAAVQHNPSQAKGLDTALLELSRQPFGPLLLAIVALGLLAYGIYSFVEARYRRVGRA